MTFYVQEMHRTSTCKAGSRCITDDDQPADFAEPFETLEEEDETRQAIECRNTSPVRFRSDLAFNGHSWALLEDGRCGGLLDGLDCERPAVGDVLFADWWSADDCDLSTTQGKQAAVIYAIIADVVSWR